MTDIVRASGAGPTEPNVLASIWSHRLIVVACAAVFAAAGLVFTATRPSVYAAEAGMLLTDPSPEARRSARDETRYIADQVAILKSVPVSERASRLASASSAQDVPAGALRRDATIRATAESNYIMVRFTAATREASVAGANSLIRAYRERVKADLEADAAAALKRINAEIAQVTRLVGRQGGPKRASRDTVSLLNRLKEQRTRLQVDAALTGDGVSNLYPALRAKKQDVGLTSALAISVMLGGLIGSGIAYWMANRRRPGQRPSELHVLTTPVAEERPLKKPRATARRVEPPQPAANEATDEPPRTEIVVAKPLRRESTAPTREWRTTDVADPTKPGDRRRKRS